MGNVTARINKAGNDFEILVDLDKALLYRKTGQGSIQNILATDFVFSGHLKRGIKASNADLQKSFGFTEMEKVAAEIIKHGEIQLPAEFRNLEHEAKVKQVIDFLSRNCLDPRTGLAHTPARIEAAMQETHATVDNRSVEEQVPEIIKKIQEKIPIKIETKKILIKVPAIHTGKIYGMLHSFSEKEEWLSDGSLSCIVNLPVGAQSEFYDKLNAVTHGSAVTTELKQKNT